MKLLVQRGRLQAVVDVARPTGFEPVIPSFVDWCLIQFGHGRERDGVYQGKDKWVSVRWNIWRTR